MRRTLPLSAALSCLLLTPAPPSLAAKANLPASDLRYQLHLYHLHTGARLDVVYRVDDHYLPEGVAELDHFLRDHRTGDEKSYDPREFDLLHDCW